VDVEQGTQVSTADGIAFKTDAKVTVPKATVSGTTITFGTRDAAVTAVVPGVSGNVLAGSIVKVPADLAAKLVGPNPVTNADPTANGTHDELPQIRQSDVDDAVANLQSQLEQGFRAALGSPGAVPSGSKLFVEAAQLGTIVCSPDPQELVEKDAESFELACHSTGVAILADTAAIADLASRRLRGVVQSGYELVDTSVSTKLGTATVSTGSKGPAVIVPVTVTGVEVVAIDLDRLRGAIKGKTVEEARAYLSQFGEVDISVSPDWATTMPSFDFRIDLRVEVASAPPSGSPPASSSSPATSSTAPPSLGPS